MRLGIVLVFDCVFMFSVSHHLTVVLGFLCLNEPRSYVVWGFYDPARVTHGIQVQREEPYKAWLKRHLIMSKILYMDFGFPKAKAVAPVTPFVCSSVNYRIFRYWV